GSVTDDRHRVGEVVERDRRQPGCVKVGTGAGVLHVHCGRVAVLTSIGVEVHAGASDLAVAVCGMAGPKWWGRLGRVEVICGGDVDEVEKTPADARAKDARRRLRGS